MKQQDRDTEILAFIEAKMPDATIEEKLLVTHEFWQFFDALWAVADRLVTEVENARARRDKSVAFASVETSPDA
ncbi:MAG: hypothetical protein AB3X44_10995 [Leptothrix sp. (in: b-proteobacteria)]